MCDTRYYACTSLHVVGLTVVAANSPPSVAIGCCEAECVEVEIGHARYAVYEHALVDEPAWTSSERR